MQLRSIAILFIATLFAHAALADGRANTAPKNYLDSVRDSIITNLSMPNVAAANGVKVKVRVLLDRSGAITGIQALEATGGDKATRNAATEALIRAVRRASPFSSLPKENYEAWGAMDIGFDFSSAE